MRWLSEQEHRMLEAAEGRAATVEVVKQQSKWVRSSYLLTVHLETRVAEKRAELALTTVLSRADMTSDLGSSEFKKLNATKTSGTKHNDFFVQRRATTSQATE